MISPTHTHTHIGVLSESHIDTGIFCVYVSQTTLVHIHPGNLAALCQNQEPEENKELCMTKDVTSIFFQVDFSLLLGVGGVARGEYQPEEDTVGRSSLPRQHFFSYSV